MKLGEVFGLILCFYICIAFFILAGCDFFYSNIFLIYLRFGLLVFIISFLELECKSESGAYAKLGLKIDVAIILRHNLVGDHQT